MGMAVGEESSENSKGRKDKNMQMNGRGSWKKKFGQIGLAVLGALVFTASPTWAVPFTGAGEGFFTVDFIFGPDGAFSHTAGTNIIRGYTTLGGAMVCNGTQTHFEAIEEPTGACSAEEFEAVNTYIYHCQFEGVEGIFHSTETSLSCASSSCFDENGNYQVGCSFTFTNSATVAGGTGTAAGSSGSWTSSGTGTFTQVGATEPGGLSLFAGTLSNIEIEGDLEFVDGSVPPDGAALENPSPGANASGIGVVSGWSCLGGELEVEFSDADGVLLTQTVLQGSERTDTEGACGDINNGFSSLINWGRLGSGERTARLIRNGEEIASSTFMVTAFDMDFLPPSVEGMCTIVDFPDTGKNATFVWETSQQSLVLESVN